MGHERCYFINSVKHSGTFKFFFVFFLNSNYVQKSVWAHRRPAKIRHDVEALNHLSSGRRNLAVLSTLSTVAPSVLEVATVPRSISSVTWLATAFYRVAS